MEAASQITPADIKAAVALWDEESGLKRLLSSEPDDGVRGNVKEKE
jgi:hypothetical protein